MASRRRCLGDVRWPERLLLIAVPVLTLLAGCAGVNPLKPHTVVQLDKTPAKAPAPVVEAGDDHASVADIVREQIQPGHYAEAAEALRRYLKQHPEDRAARFMLRQLTADPQEMLGRQRRLYVVRPGDSYSGLAASHLGDADMFVILARYNGSTDPSELRVGEKIYLPLAVSPADKAGRAASVTTRGAPAPAGSGQAGISAPISAGSADTGRSPAAKASQLQDESVALLKQGQQSEALARLDQALTLDPQLKSNGPASSSMRSQLVAQYHERAIVLYRDQQLAQAIALWNRVLAIDPAFEPAIIYRARAQELQSRLRQL